MLNVSLSSAASAAVAIKAASETLAANMWFHTRSPLCHAETCLYPIKWVMEKSTGIPIFSDNHWNYHFMLIFVHPFYVEIDYYSQSRVEYYAHGTSGNTHELFANCSDPESTFLTLSTHFGRSLWILTFTSMPLHVILDLVHVFKKHFLAAHAYLLFFLPAHWEPMRWLEKSLQKFMLQT